jgi:hypothetical protein
MSTDIISLQEPVAEKPPPTDTVTIIEHVYYQPFRHQPVDFTTRHSRKIKTANGEAFMRRVKVSSSWQKLNLLWVESASCIVIRNDTVSRGESLDLEVRFEDSQHTMLVIPKDMLRLHTKSWNSILVRCTKDSSTPCDVSVFVVPE